MATTVAPNDLYQIYEQIDPYYKTMKVGGVVGDAKHGSGYHLSSDDLRRRGLAGDYSIQCPADKRGEGRYAAGIDVTFGSLDEMIRCTQRMLAACRANDERVECVREVIGTINGRQVCGFNRVATGSGTRSRVGYVASGYSDSSHLWHIHASILRDYVDDDNKMKGLAELLAGRPRGALGYKSTSSKPAPAAPAAPSKAPVTPKYLGPYYVDPAKVSTFLWAVHPLKEDLKREPGFPITTGKTIANTDGRAWLVTEAGYRYALEYLTTTKPNPKPKPAPSSFKPGVHHTLAETTQAHTLPDSDSPVSITVPAGTNVNIGGWAGEADTHQWVKDGTVKDRFWNYDVLRAGEAPKPVPAVVPPKSSETQTPGKA